MERFIELINDLHKEFRNEEQFENIASHLMNMLCINANGQKFRITECEVYYQEDEKIYSSKQNTDRYRKDKQIEKLGWFFHWAGTDITIGDNNSIRGGILIRAVESIDKENDNYAKNYKSDSRPLSLWDVLLNTGNATIINGLCIKLESCSDLEFRVPNKKKRKGIEGEKEYNYSI